MARGVVSRQAISALRGVARRGSDAMCRTVWRCCTPSGFAHIRRRTPVKGIALLAHSSLRRLDGWRTMNERGERKQMDNSFEAVGAVELIEKSVEDGRDLIRLEIDLAKDELLHDLRSARSAAILAAIAIALALNAFASLLVALGVAVGASVVAYVGLALLVTAAVLAFAALRTMPKAPLASTLRRLEADKVTLTESLT